MPPDLDIYIITKHRDIQTIHRFLDTYVDRVASEAKGIGDLMMVRLTAWGTSLNSEEDYDWEPVSSLNHAIQRGLDYPRRAFQLYLKPKGKRLARAYMAFTTDDQLVLGLAIDDEGAKPENLKQAKKLLRSMAEQFDGYMGLIAAEQPAPLSERAFRKHEEVTLLIYSWEREKP